MTTMAQLSDAVGTYIIASLPANARQLVRGRVGDGPAPAGPYVIYRLESVTHPEFTRTEYVGDDQIIHANTVAVFVVTVVGDRPGQLAMDDASRIALGLRLTQRTADLYKICGLWSVEQVRDLTMLEIGTMRSRAELRIVLSVSAGITAAREYIDSVAVDVVSDAPPSDVSIVISAPVEVVQGAVFLLTESGEMLLAEDGSALLAEDGYTNFIALLTESGEPLLTESGEMLLAE